MKSALMLLSGVSTTVALLIGGLAVVQAGLPSALPDESPHYFKGLNSTPLWTTSPVAIPNRDAQDYERIEARLPADTVIVASLPPENKPDLSMDRPAADLDQMVTSALDDTMSPEDGEVTIGYTAEHLGWCEAKYRSYRAEDNSYLSFSGARRTCQSPFDTAEFHNAPSPVDEEPQYDETSDAPMPVYEVSEAGYESLDADAVGAQQCAERYRSYRASDNSYQPFGGGPRRSCDIRSF